MNAQQRPVRVLVVDDSALARKLLTNILGAAPGIEVVGTAIDAWMARDKIKQLQPDVLTLDVEMPGMNGLAFLANLMRLHPLPVVMISTLTEKSAAVTLDALQLGAVDFVCKPKLEAGESLDEYAAVLVDKVRAAAQVCVQAIRSPPPKHGIDAVQAPPPARPWRQSGEVLIAIGASTGGTEAIRAVLERLPPDCPGIVIAQHIPLAFSRAFAERMDAHCALHVKEAEEGDLIKPGHAYVAPGNCHLLVRREGGRLRCRLGDEVPVNRHKPSVDMLFRSVAASVGRTALGVLLTGMGKDGAQGMKDLVEAGAHTIGQDQETSVVWGMPAAAHALGACSELLPLERISARICALLAAGRPESC